MGEAPLLDVSRLDPRKRNTTIEPDFLGYTPASWARLVAEEGPVFQLASGAYVLCGHEADLAIWKTPDAWIYGPPAPGGEFFHEQLGEMHVTQLDGEAHRRSRRLILPAFGVAAVTRDLEVAADTIETGIATWKGSELDLHPVVSRLVASALSRTQLKEKLTDNEIDQLVIYEEAFIPASSLAPENRQKWYSTEMFELARNTAFSNFEKVADERLAGKRVGDSLDMIIDRAVPDGLAPLSRDELVSATYLLLVAGVGNIANILCAALWALQQHQDWLHRLYEEVKSFDAMSLKDGMKSLPVLKTVISEVERCYLPAPVIPKMANEEVQFAGYRIPAGAEVLQLHGLAHFEAERYERPFEFDPGRWLDGQCERPNAFGGGAHLCLGMGVTRLYVPLVLALVVRDLCWQVEAPPMLVPQRPDLDYSPLTTTFPVLFD